MKNRAILLLLTFLFINTLSAQNLLFNGDFQSGGNGVGFNTNGSGYTQISAPFSGTTSSGNFAITTDPQPMNTSVFLSFGDHTTGSGNMLIIDGNTTGGSQRFWEAGNSGSGVSGLTVGTTYNFSYWIRSASSTVIDAATSANIGIQIDNSSVPVLVSGSALAPLPGTWQKVVYSFVPTGSTVYIKLWNNNLNPVGNDFAVDDFSLTGPLAVTASSVNSTCAGANNGSITVYTTGGVSPYTFTLSGAASQTNSTGVFTGLAPGTYNISVTDSTPTTVSQNGIVITEPTNPLVVSPNTLVCMPTATTLTVSGGSTYTWTASPVDATLTAANNTSASPSVTPTQTTTYTVTSPVTTTTDLIANGNFSQGNVGFTSDYQYLATTTAVGAQTTYGITTNSNSWFAGFSSCVDHTTGSDKMIVFDGSTTNGGNNKLWSQTVPVIPGQNYTFSYWIQTVAAANPANIEVLINGVSVGLALAPSGTCGWTQVTYNWNSGASTSAVISLYDRVTTAAGNDFAIDDISFTTSTTCTYTKTITLTNKKPVIANKTVSICSNSSPNYTPANSLPDIVPTGTTYTWSAPVISPAGSINGASAQNTPQTSINQNLVNATFANATVTYTVTADSETAPASCSSTFTLTVTVKPNALITPKAQTICSLDSFTVAPINSSVDIVPPGTTYTWSNPVVSPASAITGGSAQASPQSSIGQTLVNITSSPATATYTVTTSTGSGANICTSTFQIVVTVLPRPAIATKVATVCYSGTFTVTPTNSATDVVPAGTTYTWSAPVISPAASISGGSAQTTPVTSISQMLTLVNLTATNATATYTVTANSDPTSSTTCTRKFTIIVNVRPSANVAPKTQSICSGDTFTVTPSNTLPDIVPTGTTYTWALPVITPAAAITGATAQNSGLAYISQTLSNTTSAPATATYTVTASSGSGAAACTSSFTITVTVNPKPTIAAKSISICNTGTINYTPPNTLPDIVPTGMTYTWTAPIISPPTAITGGTAQATPVSSFTQTLTNVSMPAVNATATYIVTAYSGTCSTTFNLVVTVSQGITIANKTISLCKTGTFDFAPTNTSPDIVPAGTTYTWTAPVISPAVPTPGITGTTAQATPVTSILQTLNNVTFPAVNATATYTVTATSGTCSTTFTLTVNVNQAVNIANIPSTICSKDTFTVTPTNNSPATNVVPTGTTYTWTTPVISPALAIIGGSAQPLPQTSISQTLTNLTAANATATYTVTASIGTGANVCTKVFTVTVTVKPSAIISEKSAIICSGSSFSVTPVNNPPQEVVPAGTTYTWGAPVIFPAGAITGGAAQAVGVATISQTLNNITATMATATYTVIAKTGASPTCINTFTIVVTVNPQPVIGPKNLTICGGTFTATPTTSGTDVVPSGTLYTWTTPVVFPVGSVSGANQQVSGISFISQTLTRTTIAQSVPATVTYTIIAKSGLAPSKCTTTFTLTVTVNPKPIITNKTASICKTGTFTITPTNTLPDVVPTGTTYTWPTPIISSPTAISGGSAQTTGVSNISQTLTNISNPPVNATATYTVTASYTSGVNVCSSTFTIVVSVNPALTIANKTLTYCRAGTINYTPVNSATDIIPSGTMYTWTAPVISTIPSDITGATAQTTPVASFNQILTNVSTPPITVSATYTVTATVGTAPNDCSATFTITVELNQGIVIANKTLTTCSDSGFSYTPPNTSPDVVPSGVTYTWGLPTYTPVPLIPITGATAQAVGQSSINQTLINSNTTNVVATYTVTATSGTCSTTFQLAVTVKSAPTVVMSPSNIATPPNPTSLQVCPGNTATLTFVGTPNSSVRIVNSSGQTSTILLGPSGTVNWTSPALNSTMVYTLLDIKRLSDACTTTFLNTFCTVNVVPNGCATVTPGDTSTTSTNASTCEVGKCFPLSMDYSPIASTTSYVVSSIPYCPQASFINPTWTQLYPNQVSNDDEWSPVFNLPVAVGNIPAFQFCFFGNNYTQINVGTNGVIAFPNPGPLAGGANCPWSFNASVPNATLIRNAIFGVYQDTNYAVAVPLPDVLTANYSIVGTYPCRKFIVNFTNLPQFSCNLTVGLQTSQIVLYEVSNIIEVYVQKRTTCIGWNSGNGVIGIQNGTGTLGYTPPGRNTGSWNATNEAWRFTPNGAPVPVTFEWREGTSPTASVISNSADITVCPTVTTTYVAEAKYQVCGIEQKASKQFTITINQDSTQEPVDLYNCGSTFNLNNVLTSVLGTLSPAGYTIKFHNTYADAQNVVNAIALPTSYIGYNGETIYMSVKDIATNCSRVKSFQLFFALPSTVAVPNSLTYCVGSSIPMSNFISTPSGATFDWTNDNTTIGLSSSFGNGNVPSFTATTPGVATITVTPTLNGCVGTPSTYTITVISGSVIANEVASICTGATFTVTPSSTLPNVIPAGTTYTWPAPVYSSNIYVSGGSAQTTGVTSISQALSNGDTVDQTATYTVTATSGTAPNICTSTFTVTVTIKPSPTVTVPTNFSVCVGDIVPTTNFTSSSTGVTYSWTNSNPAIGIGASGNGNISSFIATSNSTTLPITGTITVTPTLNGCTGVASTYVITVNPKLATTVSCGATTLNTVEFTWSAVSGATSYLVSYQVNATTPTTATDIGNLLTFTVPSLNPNDSVIITVTPVGPIGSCFAPASATCVATPCLTITNPSSAQVLCLNSDPSILSVDTTFTGANSISFVYFPTTPQIGSNMYSGGILLSTVTPTAGVASYDPPALGLPNSLPNTVGTYYVYAIANPTPAGTVCRPFQEIRVDVIPNPSITAKTAIICSNGTFSVTPVNTLLDVVPTGTTYTWTVGSVSGINGASNQTTGVLSISQTLINTTNAPINVVYTVTATSGTTPNTCSSTFTVTVTVNPTPTVTVPTPIVVCAGEVVPTTSFASLPVGGTYTWTTDTMAIGLPAMNGIGDISAFTATNSTSGSLTATITVTPTVNGCIGTPSIYTIKVNKAPTINTPTPLVVCSSNNGLSCVNLTVKNTEITSNTNYVITYHRTLPDSQSGANPLPTPFCNNQNVNMPIWVRVVDPASPGCVSLTSFNFVINPNPIPNPVITDYALCDVNSPRDGIELFNLPTKDAEVINSQPNMSIVYFATQADAIAGSPVISTPTAYSSITKLVWFRIVDTITGCYSIGSYQLVVNPLPVVHQPNPMNLCSTTNQATFDLSSNDGFVTGNLSGYTVTYYNNLLDAQNGTGTPLNASSHLGTNNDIVYIRVVNNATTCVNTTSVQLIVNQGPTVSTTSALVVCDEADNNGLSIFNLQDAIVQIFGGPKPTWANVSFYVDSSSANAGTAPLPNSYPNNVAWSQTIYASITDTRTGCKTITPIQLTVNRKPAPIVPNDYHVCDDNKDGVTLFNLTTITPQVLGTVLVPASDYSVAYYSTSLLDANTGGTTGLIPTTSLATYSSITKTLWIRVTNIATGCYEVVELHLVVDPLPNVLPFYPQMEACDTTAPIGKEIFNLTSQVSTILNGQTGMEVKFYPSPSDAASNLNEITAPSTYENTIPFNQTIGIRVENLTTHCMSYSSIDLVVKPLPVIVSLPAPYTVCEPGNFNLCSLNSTILNGATYTLSYHDSLINAQNNTNPLPCNYTNGTAIQFIYVRAESPITHCFTTMQIELNVKPSPVLPTASLDMSLCDYYTNTQDGYAQFNLSSQTPTILAAQSGASTNYTVTYYTTLAAASSNPAGVSIISTSNYLNATNPQTIWYRVEDNVTHCYNYGSFQLKVDVPIIINKPTLMAMCDTLPNDQYAIFDMETFIGTIPDHTITYYLDLNHTNQILTPNAFQNTIVANQTVFLVATNNTTGCQSFSTLTLVVNPVPTPKTNPAQLPDQCENATGSGVQVFDLTTNATYIKNNDNTVTLHYYPTLLDAENGTNEILLPNTALVGNPLLVGQVQYVYIAVTSNVFQNYNSQPCKTIVEQAFKINPLPKTATIPVYELCDYDANDTDGSTTFDLTSKESQLIANNVPALTSYTIAYYANLANAQIGTAASAIGNPSTYVSNTTAINNTQVIYYIITNSLTGCKSDIGQFTIKVNPRPKAGVFTTGFETCDDDGVNDGYYLYDLTSLNLAILAGQSSNDFSVKFFDNQADADSNTNEIVDPVNYLAYTHVVWIRVENKLTTCYRLTSFNIVIEKKPDLSFTTDTGSNVICYDFMTNQPVRTLNITVHNSTPGTFTYQWFLNGHLLSGETTDTVHAIVEGSYSVAVTSTSTNACSTVLPYEVVKSGQAVGVQNGYIITNAFTENQTIVVNVVGFGDYLYSLDDGPRQPSNIFENVPFEPNPHTIYVWDNKGGYEYSCDPLIIENIHVIDYPHYFTPNGDGIHDTWNVVGLEDQATAKIYIFDRYGKLLKQISPQGDGWDGTFNGEMLPSTDYWFTIDFTERGAEKQFKAHFTLKR